MAMDSWLLNLTRASLVGSALMAGSFFVFSVMVMPALRRLPPTDGLRAMQEINKYVNDKPLFASVFVVAGLLSFAVAASTIWTWDQPGAEYRLAGGLANGIGSFVLTMAFHIPRNNTLDKIDPTAGDAGAKWSDFYDAWVPGNHVRGAFSAAAVILLMLALTAS
jgi:uncharacterized membrane protein